MPFLSNLKQSAKRLKSECLALAIAYKDPRTPRSAKWLVALTVAYLLSPIDLIPDFIPVLGILDDLVLVPWLIRLSIRLIPPEVMQAARIAAQSEQPLKKNNWLFGGIIVVLWVLAIGFIGRLIYKRG